MENATERSPDETAEIERHKYFLSEKAGHDVGWEFAEKDWEENHAADCCVTMTQANKNTVGSILKRIFTGKQ